MKGTMKKALALVALVVTALAISAWAQSNVPTVITLSDGTAVTVNLPVAWDATLVRVAGWLATIVGIARFVLKFLPAADDGSNAPLAKIVHVLKHISLAIPDKHVAPDLSTTGKPIGTNVETSTGKAIVG